MKKSVIYIQVIARIVSPLITLTVAVLSLLPPSSIPPNISIFTISDKILHLIAYIAVSATITIALVKKDERLNFKEFLTFNKRRVIGSFCIVFLIGFMIEMVQPMFGREREFLDLVSNFLGNIVGMFLGIVFFFIIQRSLYGKK